MRKRLEEEVKMGGDGLGVTEIVLYLPDWI